MEAVSWLRGEMEKTFETTTGVPGHDTNHTNAVSNNSTFVKTATTNQGQTHLVPRRSHPVSAPAVPEGHVPLREGDNSKYTGESGASRYRALAA